MRRRRVGYVLMDMLLAVPWLTAAVARGPASKRVQSNVSVIHRKEHRDAQRGQDRTAITARMCRSCSLQTRSSWPP
ncbi:uncharacterized protein LAESUDRAFT_732122 [Laetiporus sulphureus 93-53]|uniref:Secreted protein n=1 Tax=Laetiporus sulphureus 93-53 TaxID=1314785 RepID=A0A165BAK2_9APHY|nr:uncharacterized protein LAESUDRAFT_732122 [Laetiporus sulphureus 93-53]KZT00624.1 hypothetical protein LAESUDRAFT_732122 [Laetiporus sulphureus 93-53]